MPESEGGNMTNRKRPPVVALIAAVLIGLLGLIRVMEKPRFKSYHKVDVVQLVVSGAMFGAALTGLVVRFRWRPTDTREQGQHRH